MAADRRRAAVLAALVAAACAQPMPPPGGPPDTAVPKIVSVVPESGAVNVRPRAAVITFDEVVAERGGQTGLASLVVLSPVHGETQVAWSRDQLYIRPGRGFRPDAVYTLTLLPGIADLRNNVMKEGATIVFSTGGEIPATRLSGIAFDWAKGQPITKGFVEAIRTRDSTVYFALTDSTGRFALRHLPPGEYTLVAVADANGNRRRDAREPYDSARVSLADSLDRELLAFVHDTIGPRISGLSIKDSVTLQVTFDQPLAPDLERAPTLFGLRRADSTMVAVAAVRTAAEADSIARAEAARKADSVAKADTAKKPAPAREPSATPAAPVREPIGRPGRGEAARDTAPPPPKPSRPSPISELVVQLAEPLEPGGRYALRAEGVRGLLGAVRPSERFLVIPARRDTTGADSTRATGARRPARTPTPPARTP